MLKNALSIFSTKKDQKVEEKLQQEDEEYFRELLGKYFWDVVHNKGESSKIIYRKISLYSIAHFHYYNNYKKMMEILDNYRQWEAEKLGWR